MEREMEKERYGGTGTGERKREGEAEEGGEEGWRIVAVKPSCVLLLPNVSICPSVCLRLS
jgi:hypothetical protein